MFAMLSRARIYPGKWDIDENHQNYLKMTNGHASQKPQVVWPGSRDPRSTPKTLEDQRIHRYSHLSSWCRSPLGSPDECPRTHHLVHCPSCPRPYAHHSQRWHKAAEEDGKNLKNDIYSRYLNAGQDVFSSTLSCFIVWGLYHLETIYDCLLGSH